MGSVDSAMFLAAKQAPGELMVCDLSLPSLLTHHSRASLAGSPLRIVLPTFLQPSRFTL